MKRKLSAILAVTLIAAMALTACGGSASSAPAASAASGASSAAAPTTEKQSLTLGTGGTTGTYYAVGGVMATVLNDKLGLSNLTVTSTGASKANIQLVDDGEAKLALVQNDVMYYAYNGTDLFADEGKYETFGTVACMYDETCQVIALSDKGIKSIADLKGKSVSVGDAGSGVEFNARQILAAYGLDIDKDINKINASFGDSAESMKDGKIDAAFVTAGAPTTAIVDLAMTKAVSVLSIDDEHAAALIKDYPFYVQATIPAGTYKGVDTDTKTVAVQATLIAAMDIPEDVIYDLCKTMFDNIDALKDGHAKFAELTPEDAVAGASTPFHPGAEKYFKEIGAIK
ncbi:MAG: TAXI family TRAP transporter solute-binding subunit [Pygmaiobacter sp.]